MEKPHPRRVYFFEGMAMAIWTPDDEFDREELEDLKLAIGLLAGVWTQQGANPADRFPGKRYLSGELEKQARQAIGRRTRSLGGRAPINRQETGSDQIRSQPMRQVR
jgi:hypothetical protein